MSKRLATAALPLLLLALAGCGPGAAQYTKDEAPAQLTLDTAHRSIPLRFVPGSAALARGEAARLARLARGGAIAPSDRVVVAAAGGPALAAARVAAVQHVLIAYGIVPQQGAVAVPPNRGLLQVARTLVTLPPCPDWSKPSAADFTNTLGSNFGCATASNLGVMVADPGDLAAGRPLGPANGALAAAAVERYATDRVYTAKQFDGASASPGSTAATNTATTGGGGGAQ